MTHELQLRESNRNLEFTKSLPNGSFVKVCAELADHQGDWFWVQLTFNHGEEWTGEIKTSPVFHQAKPGDRIYLRAENVFDSRYPDDPPNGL